MRGPTGSRGGAGASPRTTFARLAGVAYLVIIVTGVFAEFFVRQPLIVSGDAGATAHSVLASEALFRMAIGSEFAMLGADVFVAAALYVLFEPVGRVLALLAAFFRLTHTAVLGANLLNMFFPLLLLGDGGRLGPTAPQVLTLVFLEAHAIGYTVGLVFFGFSCLALGAVAYRSGLVPKPFGGLLVLAGLGYLTDSFARALLKDYAAVQPVLEVMVFTPAFIAELSFALWLVVRGVKSPDGMS